ncbi:hypothetical protein EBN03_27375 [Nocardia stercoris]|uniref:Uncharacterized protein n=1 Tax=Nocardia stercoris TaxID=2483361 RepID=A0A3M2KUQ4_9NOCA|nr:hypothetical protein EBN03_27375 [Nocardia stercoris]
MLRYTGIAAVTIAVVAGVVAGALQPRPAQRVATDRLGPDSGEPVAAYLARSRDSLRGTDSAPHWALLSAASGLDPASIPDLTGGLRVSQVLVHVPLDRVSTPDISVIVPADPAQAAAAEQVAAGHLLAELGPAGDTGHDPVLEPDPGVVRELSMYRVVAGRLRAGCACVVGLVVRGPLDRLRELAGRPGARAVQALPADAGAGNFSVVPLLPEQLDAVTPGPDDGPVPPG